MQTFIGCEPMLPVSEPLMLLTVCRYISPSLEFNNQFIASLDTVQLSTEGGLHLSSSPPKRFAPEYLAVFMYTIMLSLRYLSSWHDKVRIKYVNKASYIGYCFNSRSCTASVILSVVINIDCRPTICRVLY